MFLETAWKRTWTCFNFLSDEYVSKRFVRPNWNFTNVVYLKNTRFQPRSLLLQSAHQATKIYYTFSFMLVYNSFTNSTVWDKTRWSESAAHGCIRRAPRIVWRFWRMRLMRFMNIMRLAMAIRSFTGSSSSHFLII